MRKRMLSTLLALVLCLGLLPATARAAEETLPDWYFLFAIFKNVDATGKDKDGKTVHVTHTMSQDEISAARDHAGAFETFMNQLGIIRAHMEIVEIDTTITRLRESSSGSYLSAEIAAPLLSGKVDLDRYDHVTCIISLDNLKPSYGGITGSPFENGTGQSCINFANQERAIQFWAVDVNPWAPGYPVHEFLHFMERMGKKWGGEFDLHTIMSDPYERVNGEFEECYTDILLNQARGDAGTGVHPAVWQYPPHVLRTMTELAVPFGVTSIGHDAFLNYANLTSITIPSSVTFLDVSAFNGCTGLTSVALPSSLTRIEEWTFANCSALTEMTIPSGVTSIGGASFQRCTSLTSLSLPESLTSVEQYAFANCSKLTDVYYGGAEAQWKAIQISSTSNGSLTNANIHYNSLMADVKTTDWFAAPVAWALENGIAGGTGGYKFSPKDACTQGQILTFLWRAKGEPVPEGPVSGKEYYAEAVQWAREQGLVGDDLSGVAPCTRADVVTYLWKLAGSPAAGSADFSDVPAGAPYARAVAWAVAQGITGGTGNGQFSPDGACTRGEIVTFLYRALR